MVAHFHRLLSKLILVVSAEYILGNESLGGFKFCLYALSQGT